MRWNQLLRQLTFETHLTTTRTYDPLININAIGRRQKREWTIFIFGTIVSDTIFRENCQPRGERLGDGNGAGVNVLQPAKSGNG